MIAGLQDDRPQDEISVLVLDDDDFDRRRLARMGAASGLPLCLDAVPTIEALKRSIDEKAFDVFFLDYKLSSGTGLDALGFIKDHPIQQNAAVVMVTGYDMVEVAVTALKSGCSDYLAKQDLTPGMLRKAVLGVLPMFDKGPHRKSLEEHTLATAMGDIFEQRLPDLLNGLIDNDQLQQKMHGTMSKTLETSLRKVLDEYQLPKDPLSDPITVSLVEELNREASASLLYD